MNQHFFRETNTYILEKYEEKNNEKKMQEKRGQRRTSLHLAILH